MTTIAHLSDTHFGTEIPAVVNAIKQSLAALKPDILIVSGDITQRARRSQFKAAADFIASVEAPTKIVIPGNHDIPLYNVFARFLTPYGNYKQALGERQTVWCCGHLGIIGYDTTYPLRHTRGRLTAKTLRKLAEDARRQLSPGATLIACIHQPLAVAWPEDTHELLIQAGETAQLFAEYAVDLVLSGHVHVPLITTTHTYFPSLSRHFIIGGACTATSHRVRPGAPNSFNVIRVQNSAISIALQEYDAASQRFREKTQTAFVKQPQGWVQS